MVGRFPAVVAPVHGPDGTLQSAHRIYVGEVSPRKKLMRPIDTVKGGAIRLFDVADTVGIAEGVETAVACYERDLVPTWAALSATILEQFQPPEGVTTVIVYGDHDPNYAGQRSAYVLANRLVREGYSVDVQIPSVPGDWLDIHAATEVAHAV
jgi:putative DNA primase/helicase